MTSPDTLRRDFGGAIIEPDSPEYESASRSVLATGRPAYVLQPATVDDVAAAVTFARDSGLPLSIRGGGHSMAGLSTNEGGIVIDLRRLSTIEVVDKERGLVRIGGGATWGEVAEALAPHGLAISSGDTRSVGVGGLTLAGGIGWKVRKYGLALDSLDAAEIITADGQRLRAGAEENPELFWAIRGGGGNLGVVTSFDFVAQPTTDLYVGVITFPAEQLSSVLTGWAAALRVAPEELNSTIEFANPFAGGPKAPVQIRVAVDTDDADRAARLLEPIRRLGTPIADEVELKPYADLLEEGMTPPPGIKIIARSAFVEPPAVDSAVALLAEIGSTEGSPFFAVRSLGGAFGRVPADGTAFGYRDAELLVVATSIGPEPVIEASRPARDAIWAKLSPNFSGAYAGFLSTATPEDVAALYPQPTYQRLAAVKRRHDPANLFAGNHNVRP